GGPRERVLGGTKHGHHHTTVRPPPAPCRHARFPLYTATISERIDRATSAGALPPMSTPIGVSTRASSSSVNPSLLNKSRIATPRYLLPSIPMYPTGFLST